MQKFYLVGVANDESKYRVMKIDRTTPTELVITDDKVGRGYCEIHFIVVVQATGRNAVRFEIGGFSETDTEMLCTF